jgi:hypothetical protein
MTSEYARDLWPHLFEPQTSRAMHGAVRHELAARCNGQPTYAIIGRSGRVLGLYAAGAFTPLAQLASYRAACVDFPGTVPDLRFAIDECLALDASPPAVRKDT